MFLRHDYKFYKITVTVRIQFNNQITCNLKILSLIEINMTRHDLFDLLFLDFLVLTFAI